MRPGQGRTQAFLFLSPMGCWVGLPPSVPPWPSKLPPKEHPSCRHQLTLIVEQSMLHHGARSPLWKAEVRLEEPRAQAGGELFLPPA